MFDCMLVKKGAARRLVAVFVDGGGGLKAGLTVGVRVVRKSDGEYLEGDGSWASSPSAEHAAAEWDAVNLPGVYCFDWALPEALDEYLVRFDGGSGAANRYQFAYVQAVAVDAADMHKVKAALVNKQVQTIGTGEVAIMDDDGVATLVTLTPAVDDVSSPTRNILSPS
jgi:hypothetical protein